MAKTGNKYAIYQNLDTAAPVNWGTVANTLSEGLLAAREDRIKRKDAIDQATVDQMEQLNKLPEVNDQTVSAMLMKSSDNSKTQLKQQMDLVKRGLLKPKDYALFMQEQKNGYSNFSDILKGWDTWNTTKMAQIADMSQSQLDEFAAMDVAGFGNLQGKDVMINPTNGQLQIVQLQKDPETGKFTKMPNAIDNPEAFQNPAIVKSLMKFDEKKIDTTAAVKKETDAIAKVVSAGVNLENGVVTTVEDYRQSDSFDTWKNSIKAKLTSNVYSTTQVLTQNGYVLGRTVEEAKKKWVEKYGEGEGALPFEESKFIEVDMSGQKPLPKLNKEQVKAAKDIVGNSIESQLDSIENKGKPFNNSAQNTKNKKDLETKSGRVKAMNDILSAENSQDAINRIDTDSTYENVESMQMVDENGNNIKKKDWEKAKEIKIDYYDPEKGEMTQGTVRLFDDKGNKKSNDKIVMDMVEKLGIPTEDLESYKEAFKKKYGDGKFNEFKGIANYKRASAELVDTGSIKVVLGSKNVNVSQGVSNVLKEDFKNENIDEFEAILTDNTQTPEDKKLAEDKLDSYRWSLVGSMVSEAFSKKIRGKGVKLVVGEDGKLSIRLGTEDIDLGLTKGSLQNDGSTLMTTIEEKINSSKGKTPGGLNDL